MATVLYLTQDGITDHIGQAQIAPYLDRPGQARSPHPHRQRRKAGREEPIARYEATFRRGRDRLDTRSLRQPAAAHLLLLDDVAVVAGGEMSPAPSTRRSSIAAPICRS